MAKHRARTVGLGCLGLLLAGGFSLWLFWNRVATGKTPLELPPRILAKTLGDRLAARVQLDRFEVLSRHRFRLTGLTITDFRDYPYIQRLELAELAIEASIEGLLDQRFERLRLRGLEVQLAPAPPVEPPDRPLPTIGELVLEPAILRIATDSGTEDLHLCLSANVRHIGPSDGSGVKSAPLVSGGGSFLANLLGPRANGAGSVNAPLFDLQPISELGAMSVPKVKASAQKLYLQLAFDANSLEGIAQAAFARLQADRPGALESGALLELSGPVLDIRGAGPLSDLEMDADEVTVELDGRSVTLGQPSLDGALASAGDGAIYADLSTRWNGLESGRLSAELDLALQRWSWLNASLHQLETVQVAPDFGLEALADVELSGTNGRVGYRLRLEPQSWALDDDRWLSDLKGSAIEVVGGLAASSVVGGASPSPVGGGEPIEASVQVPSARGHWNTLPLPSEIFPIEANFRGRWQGGGAPSLTGRGGLDSSIGRWTTDGRVELNRSPSSAPDLSPVVHADLAWTWIGIDLAQMARLLESFEVSLPVQGLEGRGQAQGRLRGPLTTEGPAVDGEVHLRRWQAQAGDASGDGRGGGQGSWHLRDGESNARWTWAGGDAPVVLRQLEGSTRLETPELAPLVLGFEAQGTLDPRQVHGRLKADLDLTQQIENSETSELGSVHLEGDWRPSVNRGSAPIPEISGRVSLQGFDLGRWQKMLPPSSTEDLLTNFALKGAFSTELEGALTQGVWTLNGPAQLESAGFTSTDGSRVSEGLVGRFDLALRGTAFTPLEAAPLEAAPLEVQVQGQLGGFLLLWGTFFGDFSTVEATVSAQARVKGQTDEAQTWSLDLEGSLPKGPVVQLSLEGQKPQWRYDFTLDANNLATTYQRYLAPLFEAQLGPIEVSGQLATRGSGYVRPGDPTAWSLTGGVEIQGLDLASDDRKTTIRGLTLNLPIDLRRSETPVPAGEAVPLKLSGPRLAGSLAFEQLTVRDLELPRVESQLAVEADAVGLENPVTLDVLGGSLTLGRLTFRDLLRPSRHLESGIELSGIRLERISEELGLLPLEGALNGRLAGVRLSPSRLQVDGGGVIEAFGGTVEVRDISGEEVLSRFPKIKLSAEFRDLDLGALTRRIDFGEMTGTLQGHLENLELFRGVPVRFAARLETIERPGVSRTVDVKAVNNLTILGTGQRASVLDRGLQKFFDRYTYDRLAIDMHLDRDVLLLRGLEQRGEKELFLRGRLPFRIDVVNAQPGRTVSFQTMVERLKSLDFAGVKTER